MNEGRTLGESAICIRHVWLKVQRIRIEKKVTEANLP